MQQRAAAGVCGWAGGRVVAELEYSDIVVPWRAKTTERRDKVNEHLAAWARDGWEMIHYKVGPDRSTDDTIHQFIWRRESKIKGEAAGIPIHEN
jgi:hypothetical protein